MFHKKAIQIDDDGIPVKVNDDGLNGYSPVDVANYAMDNYSSYLNTGDKKYEESFFIQLNWLVSNIDNGTWQYYYDNPRYKLKAPWIGGLAQGLGISCLVKGYRLTNKSIYLETAKKAYRVFEKNISDGGVRFMDEHGDVWFEEYAVLPPSKILNGFISALFGIRVLYDETKNNNILKSFNDGIKTLEKNIHTYDLGYWSLYNLVHEHPATLHYHSLHVWQLSEIYRMTKSKIMARYAAKWEEYLDSRLCKTKAKIVRNIVHVKRRI